MKKIIVEYGERHPTLAGEVSGELLIKIVPNTLDVSWLCFVYIFFTDGPTPQYTALEDEANQVDGKDDT